MPRASTKRRGGIAVCRLGKQSILTSDSAGLVVKPDVAARQLDAEVESRKPFRRRIAIKTVLKSIDIHRHRRLHPLRPRSFDDSTARCASIPRVSGATPAASPMR